MQTQSHHHTMTVSDVQNTQGEAPAQPTANQFGQFAEGSEDQDEDREPVQTADEDTEPMQTADEGAYPTLVLQQDQRELAEDQDPDEQRDQINNLNH